MSVHTYFQKNKKSYFREKQLYEILDNTNINLCASEYQAIEDEVTKLMEENSDYICDIFRTNKPYYDVFLYSEKECLLLLLKKVLYLYC